MSFRDMVESLATSSLKFQQNLHQLNMETKSFQQEARTDLTNIGNQVTIDNSIEQARKQR